MIDDDQDCVWLKVDVAGGASCHVGYRCCFYRRIPLGADTAASRVHGHGEGLRPAASVRRRAEPDATLSTTRRVSARAMLRCHRQHGWSGRQPRSER